MPFTQSGTVITQTGTDANLSGMSSLAGVTVSSRLSHTEYDIGANRLVINGDLTIAGAAREQFVFRGDDPHNQVDIQVNSGGSLTLGEFEANPLDYDFQDYIPAIQESINPNAIGFSVTNGFLEDGRGQAGRRASLWVQSGASFSCYARTWNVASFGTGETATIDIQNSTMTFHASAYMYGPNVTLINSTYNGFSFVSPVGYDNISNNTLMSSAVFNFSSSTPSPTVYTIANIRDLNGLDLFNSGTSNASLVTSDGIAINLETGSDQQYSTTASREWNAFLRREIGFNTANADGSVLNTAKVFYVGAAGTETVVDVDSVGRHEFTFEFATIRALGGVVQPYVFFTKNADTTDDLIDVRAIEYRKSILENNDVSLRGLNRLEVTLPLLPDFLVTEQDSAIVAGYTSIDSSAQFYDRAKLFLFDNYDGETATIVTRSVNEIDAGSSDVVIDPSAASVFDYDGSTITIRATAYSGSIRTTGTVTLMGAATVSGAIIDSVADSILSFSGIDSWSVYETQSDADANIGALGSGAGSQNYRFTFSSGTTFFMRLTVSGETTLSSVTPAQSGETEVSLQTAALLTAVTAGLSFIPRVVYVDTTMAANGNGTNISPYNNIDDGVALFNTGGYTFVSLKSTIASPATPTTSLAGVKLQGVDKFSSINLNGQSFDGATIQNLLVLGAQSATDTLGVIIEDARIIGDLTNLRGIIKETEVLNPTGGPVTISVNVQAAFIDSSVINASPVTFDLANSVVFGMRGSDGRIVVSGTTGGLAYLEMNSGNVTIDASCTGGDIRVSDGVTVTDNADGASVNLDGAGIVSIPSGINALVSDGALTLAESIRLQNAVLFGQVSGAGSGTETFRDPADTLDRVVSTVDSDGNRTEVVRKQADIEFLMDMIYETNTVIIPVISYYLVRLFGERYWNAA